jgi:hypothetical protein
MLEEERKREVEREWAGGIYIGLEGGWASNEGLPY